MSYALTTTPARVAIAVLFSLLLHTQSAMAHDNQRNSDHGDRDRGRSEYRHDRFDDDNSRHRHHDKTIVYRTKRPDVRRIEFTTININPWQADIVRYDLARRHHTHVPPGLRGYPPGRAYGYRIGYPLPPTVIWQRVPDYVTWHLPEAPRGTFYAYADRDLVLLSEATKKVLDAVVLFSAID